MNYRFLAQAAAEFEESIERYDEKRFGLGQEFSDAVHAAIQRIQESPELHSIYFGQYRYCPTERFPYIVIYRFDEMIHITAVAHMSREPGYWLSRDQEA
jgi:toxin ParE1/3/4